MQSESEAYNTWLDAYTKNYGHTGLMGAQTLARQAWQAALNYRDQKDKAEAMEPKYWQCAKCYSLLKKGKPEVGTIKPYGPCPFCKGTAWMGTDS